MLKKSLTVLSLAAAYFVAAQDVSTIRNTTEVYGNSALNGSAKYNSMAGSMGALGGDVSLLNTNPAGVGVSIASEISGTLSIEGNKNVTSFGGKSLDYKKSYTDLGNVGAIATFQINNSKPWKFVNIAVNYSNRSLDSYSETPGDAGIVYDIKDDTGAVIDQLQFAGHAYNRYGNLSKMSLGVGANYDHRIYVGAGLNFHNANLDQYDSAAFTDQAGVRDVYDKQYTPFSESATGFSATVGVIGKISPEFRLGASLETPTWWTMNRVYSEYENPLDGTYSEDRNLASPMKATLSAAYVANKNFAINVDYSLGLTKSKYSVYGAAETELNRFYADNAASLSELKAGAEYRIDNFRLRGGYAFTSSPFKTVALPTFNSSAESFADFLGNRRNMLTAGIGYDFKAFYIDAAYQNIQSEYSMPFLQGSAVDNTGYFSNQYIVNSDVALVSKVKNTKDNFFITLGWKF